MTITKQREEAMQKAMAVCFELLTAVAITPRLREEIKTAHTKLYKSLNGIPEDDFTDRLAKSYATEIKS